MSVNCIPNGKESVICSDSELQFEYISTPVAVEAETCSDGAAYTLVGSCVAGGLVGAEFGGPYGAAAGCVVGLFALSSPGCTSSPQVALDSDEEAPIGGTENTGGTPAQNFGGTGGAEPDMAIPAPAGNISRCEDVAAYEDGILVCSSPALLETFDGETANSGSLVGSNLRGLSATVLGDRVHSAFVDNESGEVTVFAEDRAHLAGAGGSFDVLSLPSGVVGTGLIDVMASPAVNEQTYYTFLSNQGLLTFYQGSIESDFPQVAVDFANCSEPLALLSVERTREQARAAVLCNGQTSTFLPDYEILITDADGSHQTLIDLTDPNNPGSSDFDPLPSNTVLQMNGNTIIPGVDGRIMVTSLEDNPSADQAVVKNARVIDALEGRAIQTISAAKNSNFFFALLQDGSVFKISLQEAKFGEATQLTTEPVITNAESVTGIQVGDSSEIFLVLAGESGREYQRIKLSE